MKSCGHRRTTSLGCSDRTLDAALLVLGKRPRDSVGVRIGVSAMVCVGVLYSAAMGDCAKSATCWSWRSVTTSSSGFKKQRMIFQSDSAMACLQSLAGRASPPATPILKAAVS